MSDFRCIGCGQQFPRRYLRDDHEDECERAYQWAAAEDAQWDWLDGCLGVSVSTAGNEPVLTVYP